MSRGDSGGVVNGLGGEVEPEVRSGFGSVGIGDRRRYRCTRCENTKLVRVEALAEKSTDGGDDGEDRDRRMGCSECGKQTPHEPDSGRTLDYYRRKGAIARRRAALVHTDSDTDTGSDANADADGGGL